tara:strand:- start:684 stop:1151 length:468 start_codon:yes stop_codon:yes gene_type:complete
MKYREHILGNLFLLTAVFWFNDHYLIIFPTSVQYFVFIIGFVVGTFFITPDLDIYGSRASKAWDGFRFIWYPYSKCFCHGKISHFPIVGTFTRLSYLGFVLVFVVYLLSEYAGLPISVSVFRVYRWELLILLGGILFANFGHVLLDWVSRRLRLI